MIFLGYLMICRLKFPSLKMLHFRIPSFHLVFLMVMATVFVIYGILYFFALILALVAWSYVVVSLILSFIRLMAEKNQRRWKNLSQSLKISNTIDVYVYFFCIAYLYRISCFVVYFSKKIDGSAEVFRKFIQSPFF